MPVEDLVDVAKDDFVLALHVVRDSVLVHLPHVALETGLPWIRLAVYCDDDTVHTTAPDPRTLSAGPLRLSASCVEAPSVSLWFTHF